ncbi:hypothetical protein AB0I28_12485 [Phytomonospora sp. NPDC050363]|uniref:hypothetical protein n=1 Tax=Phytomonospora sp. NPDC050363 TaxID=3155642 RepID=UPI00340A4D9F
MSEVETRTKTEWAVFIPSADPPLSILCVDEADARRELWVFIEDHPGAYIKSRTITTTVSTTPWEEVQ